MLVTIKKKVEQESQVELALPAYFKANYSRYMICENEDIVEASRTQITVWPRSRVCYDSTIAEALESSSCTREEFMENYSAALEAFSTAIISPKEPVTV